jgi:hypothetical protein
MRVLVHASFRYFHSVNCMRELLFATFKDLPIDVVMEPKTSSSGMTRNEVWNCLLEAEEKYTVWGLQREMEQWGFSPPDGLRYADHLYRHLFRYEPLEWSNILLFQKVLLRILAGRLVQEPEEARSSSDAEEARASSSVPASPSTVDRRGRGAGLRPSTDRLGFYTQVEGLHEKVELPTLHAFKFHLYVSDCNPGATQVVEKAAAEFVDGAVLIASNLQDVLSRRCPCSIDSQARTLTVTKC